MPSQGSITNTTGYVNYVYNISARGTAQVASQLLGLSGIAGNILGQIAFQTSSYLSSTEGSLLSLGVVASAGLTKATKFAMKFNQEMETVHAISGQTVTSLANDAMEMSNKFGVALGDMTTGLEALARAGVSTGNMTVILEQAMGLSKLEGLTLEQSINDLISTTNLLDTKNLDLESPEYAEAVKYQTQKITATSEAAPINAQDIIHTLEHVGGYASSTNIDQDDLYAVIAQLGSKGTKSEMAGTSLRAFLAAGQKDTAQRALKRIGLNVKDLWKDDETIMSISDMKDVLDEAMEARGYTQQEKLEFYSDFAGYKQANQIMKIDTTSVREFKDKIDRSWDTSKKMQTVLNTAQTNLQSLMQTGINFLTKVGEPLLLVVSPIAKVAKTMIDIVDAIPFSNWVVALGLSLVSIKAISTIFNKLGPQLLASTNHIFNMSTYWQDTKDAISESYDILKHWKDFGEMRTKGVENEIHRVTTDDKIQYWTEQGYNVKTDIDIMRIERDLKTERLDEIRAWKRERLEPAMTQEEQSEDKPRGTSTAESSVDKNLKLIDNRQRAVIRSIKQFHHAFNVYAGHTHVDKDGRRKKGTPVIFDDDILTGMSDHVTSIDDFIEKIYNILDKGIPQGLGSGSGGSSSGGGSSGGGSDDGPSGSQRRGSRQYSHAIGPGIKFKNEDSIVGFDFGYTVNKMPKDEIIKSILKDIKLHFKTDNSPDGKYLSGIIQTYFTTFLEDAFNKPFMLTGLSDANLERQIVDRLGGLNSVMNTKIPAIVSQIQKIEKTIPKFNIPKPQDFTSPHVIEKNNRRMQMLSSSFRFSNYDDMLKIVDEELRRRNISTEGRAAVRSAIQNGDDLFAWAGNSGQGNSKKFRETLRDRNINPREVLRIQDIMSRDEIQHEIITITEDQMKTLLAKLHDMDNVDLSPFSSELTRNYTFKNGYDVMAKRTLMDKILKSITSADTKTSIVDYINKNLIKDSQGPMLDKFNREQLVAMGRLRGIDNLSIKDKKPALIKALGDHITTDYDKIFGHLSLLVYGYSHTRQDMMTNFVHHMKTTNKEQKKAIEKIKKVFKTADLSKYADQAGNEDLKKSFNALFKDIDLSSFNENEFLEKMWKKASSKKMLYEEFNDKFGLKSNQTPWENVADFWLNNNSIDEADAFIKNKLNITEFEAMAKIIPETLKKNTSQIKYNSDAQIGSKVNPYILKVLEGYMNLKTDSDGGFVTNIQTIAELVAELMMPRKADYIYTPKWQKHKNNYVRDVINAGRYYDLEDTKWNALYSQKLKDRAYNVTETGTIDDKNFIRQGQMYIPYDDDIDDLGAYAMDHFYRKEKRKLSNWSYDQRRLKMLMPDQKGGFSQRGISEMENLLVQVETPEGIKYVPGYKRRMATHGRDFQNLFNTKRVKTFVTGSEQHIDIDQYVNDMNALRDLYNNLPSDISDDEYKKLSATGKKVHDLIEQGLIAHAAKLVNKRGGLGIPKNMFKDFDWRDVLKLEMLTNSDSNIFYSRLEDAKKYSNISDADYEAYKTFIDIVTQNNLDEHSIITDVVTSVMPNKQGNYNHITSPALMMRRNKRSLRGEHDLLLGNLAFDEGLSEDDILGLSLTESQIERRDKFFEQQKFQTRQQYIEKYGMDAYNRLRDQMFIKFEKEVLENPDEDPFFQPFIRKLRKGEQYDPTTMEMVGKDKVIDFDDVRYNKTEIAQTLQLEDWIDKLELEKMMRPQIGGNELLSIVKKVQRDNQRTEFKDDAEYTKHTKKAIQHMHKLFRAISRGNTDMMMSALKLYDESVYNQLIQYTQSEIDNITKKQKDIGVKARTKWKDMKRFLDVEPTQYVDEEALRMQGFTEEEIREQEEDAERWWNEQVVQSFNFDDWSNSSFMGEEGVEEVFRERQEMEDNGVYNTHKRGMQDIGVNGVLNELWNAERREREHQAKLKHDYNMRRKIYDRNLDSMFDDNIMRSGGIYALNTLNTLRYLNSGIAESEYSDPDLFLSHFYEGVEGLQDTSYSPSVTDYTDGYLENSFSSYDQYVHHMMRSGKRYERKHISPLVDEIAKALEDAKQSLGMREQEFNLGQGRTVKRKSYYMKSGFGGTLDQFPDELSDRTDEEIIAEIIDNRLIRKIRKYEEDINGNKIRYKDARQMLNDFKAGKKDLPHLDRWYNPEHKGNSTGQHIFNYQDYIDAGNTVIQRQTNKEKEKLYLDPTTDEFKTMFGAYQRRNINTFKGDMQNNADFAKFIKDNVIHFFEAYEAYEMYRGDNIGHQRRNKNIDNFIDGAIGHFLGLNESMPTPSKDVLNFFKDRNIRSFEALTLDAPTEMYSAYDTYLQTAPKEKQNFDSFIMDYLPTILDPRYMYKAYTTYQNKQLKSMESMTGSSSFNDMYKDALYEIQPQNIMFDMFNFDMGIGQFKKEIEGKGLSRGQLNKLVAKYGISTKLNKDINEYNEVVKGVLEETGKWDEAIEELYSFEQEHYKKRLKDLGNVGVSVRQEKQTYAQLERKKERLDAVMNANTQKADNVAQLNEKIYNAASREGVQYYLEAGPQQYLEAGTEIMEQALLSEGQPSVKPKVENASVKFVKPEDDSMLSAYGDYAKEMAKQENNPFFLQADQDWYNTNKMEEGYKDWYNAQNREAEQMFNNVEELRKQSEEAEKRAEKQRSWMREMNNSDEEIITLDDIANNMTALSTQYYTAHTHNASKPIATSDVGFDVDMLSKVGDLDTLNGIIAMLGGEQSDDIYEIINNAQKIGLTSDNITEHLGNYSYQQTKKQNRINVARQLGPEGAATYDRVIGYGTKAQDYYGQAKTSVLNFLTRHTNLSRNNDAQILLDEFSGRLQGTVDTLTIWSEALTTMSEVFPPLKGALLGLQSVISVINQTQKISQGISRFAKMGNLLAAGEKIKFLGSDISKATDLGKIVMAGSGALSTAMTTIVDLLITFAAPLIAIGAALFVVKQALDWSYQSHQKWLKSLEEEQKEKKSKAHALQTTTQDARNRAEHNTAPRQQDALDRNYILAQKRLDNANMSRRKGAMDLTRARNDTLWGDYGVAAGLSKITGNYESTAEDYDGTTKEIRKIKEATLANPFATSAMKRVSAYYDANQLAFGQIDEYKDELGELYDMETNIMKKVGPDVNARETDQFKKAVHEFSHATGISSERALKYLDYMQTEHNVDKATQAMQAQADTIAASTEMKIQAISFGGNPADVLGLNGIESQQSAMIKAQGDMIKAELTGQLWWKAVWATITAPVKLIISPIFAIANLLGAIWAFMTGNWSEAWDRAGKATDSFNVFGEAATYWSAWGEAESTDFNAIGNQAVDERNRRNYGNATATASGMGYHNAPQVPNGKYDMIGQFFQRDKPQEPSSFHHDRKQGIIAGFFGGVMSLLGTIISILTTGLLLGGVAAGIKKIFDAKGISINADSLSKGFGAIKDKITGFDLGNIKDLTLKDMVTGGVERLKNISLGGIWDTVSGKGKGLKETIKNKAMWGRFGLENFIYGQPEEGSGTIIKDGKVVPTGERSGGLKDKYKSFVEQHKDNAWVQYGNKKLQSAKQLPDKLKEQYVNPWKDYISEQASSYVNGLIPLGEDYDDFNKKKRSYLNNDDLDFISEKYGITSDEKTAKLRSRDVRKQLDEKELWGEASEELYRRQQKEAAGGPLGIIKAHINEKYVDPWKEHIQKRADQGKEKGKEWLASQKDKFMDKYGERFGLTVGDTSIFDALQDPEKMESFVKDKFANAKDGTLLAQVRDKVTTGKELLQDPEKLHGVLKDKYGDKIQRGKELLQDPEAMEGFVKDKFTNLKDKVTNFFDIDDEDDGKSFFRKHFDNIKEKVMSFFGKKGEADETGEDTPLLNTSEIIQNTTMEDAKEAMGKLFGPKELPGDDEDVIDLGPDEWSTVSSKIEGSFTDRIRDYIDGLQGTMGDIFENMKNNIQGFDIGEKFQSVKDRLSSLFGDDENGEPGFFKKHFNKFKDKIFSFFGKKSEGEPEDGGMIDSLPGTAQKLLGMSDDDGVIDLGPDEWSTVSSSIETSFTDRIRNKFRRKKKNVEPESEPEDVGEEEYKYNSMFGFFRDLHRENKEAQATKAETAATNAKKMAKEKHMYQGEYYEGFDLGDNLDIDEGVSRTFHRAKDKISEKFGLSDKIPLLGGGGSIIPHRKPAGSVEGSSPSFLGGDNSIIDLMPGEWSTVSTSSEGGSLFDRVRSGLSNKRNSASSSFGNAKEFMSNKLGGGKLGGGKVGGALKGLGGKLGKTGIGKAGSKVLSKVGGKLGGKLLAKGGSQVLSKVLAGGLAATGIGAPLAAIMASPIGGFLIEGAMNLGGAALGGVGKAFGGVKKALGFGGYNNTGGGGLLGGAMGLGGMLGLGGMVAGGVGGMLGGILGMGKGSKGGGMFGIMAGALTTISGKHDKNLELSEKQNKAMNKVADKVSSNSNSSTTGGNITIQNININTDDDPEAIKAMFLDLIVELQEQVNPRLVSRTTGSSNTSTNDSSDQTSSDQSQQQSGSGTPNTTNPGPGGH